MQTIKDLVPELLWRYFSEILQIPRPSKKEGKILQYILDFAEKHDLLYMQDDAGNILILKPAYRGFERKKTIVLQSHVDMVCEKNALCQHNFETDPIEAYIDDKWIKAKGTTLGADNGIGIATQLAILADQNLKHGPIECLFTVDEESGMTGALRLKDNFFSGQILINLDSEDEGEIFIGCAGGIDTVISLPVTCNPVNDNKKALLIQVKGLQGGHSGDDINKARGNAIKILARLLWSLSQQIEFRLNTIQGGNLRNAIPRESKAIISYDPDKEEEIIKLLEIQTDEIKIEYVKESNLIIHLEPVKPVDQVINKESQKIVLNCLHTCPNGVIEMSKSIPQLVETSTNLASVELIENRTIEIVTSQRSSVESAKQNIASRIRSLFELAGANVIHTNSYPGWDPDTDSEILRIAEESYRSLFKITPKVKAIHAGLECGLILEKYPELDMISVGPTIRGAHSPDERLEIGSVEKFWRLLLNILERIPV